MIPYVKVPELTIGPLPLHAFGLLVATGVVIGTALATTRARKRGYDLDLLNSFITWMLVVGFIGGHVLDEIFYHPDEIAQDPLSLLKLWAGLSSFGGFTGAFIGILLWKYFDYNPMGSPQGWGFVRNRPPRPILPFADLIVSVFPVFAVLAVLAFLVVLLSSFFIESSFFIVSCLVLSCFIVSWAKAAIGAANKHATIKLPTNFFMVFSLGDLS